MTGRPSLPIGTYGEVTVVEIEPGVHRARAYVRDLDGSTRRVQRLGKSRNAAKNNLTAAIAERFKAAGGGDLLTPDSRIAEVAAMQVERWRAAVAAGRRAPRTLEAYEGSLRLHILPAIGGLRLREATTGRCELWLQALQKKTSPGIAKRARVVLSAVLGLAARMDAIPANPVRELSPVEGPSKTRKPRALTADERAQWLGWLDTHAARPPGGRKPGARRDDALIAAQALGDISRLMLGTGVRIGEALAIGWDDVSFETGTVAIQWHLVRVRGHGLQRLSGTKSKAGVRLLSVPSWLLEMLERRRAENPLVHPVFPSLIGGWRDPSDVIRKLRWSRDEAGFPWLTSHRFRQTVITFLDDGDVRTREVADQVGHAQLSQTQAYMARKVASDRSARRLESILDVPVGPDADADDPAASS